MTDAAHADRLAEFLCLVAAGCSQRSAARIAGVSRETLWRKRRSSPEFAAALHEAERHGSLIRAELRDEHFSEQWFRLALEASDLGWQKDWTKRQRELWQRWRGEWPEPAFPGTSPSHSETVDPVVTEKMRSDFAKRRAEKRARLGLPPEVNAPSVPAGNIDRREHCGSGAAAASDNNPLSHSPKHWADPPPSGKPRGKAGVW